MWEWVPSIIKLVFEHNDSTENCHFLSLNSIKCPFSVQNRSFLIDCHFFAKMDEKKHNFGHKCFTSKSIFYYFFTSKSCLLVNKRGNSLGGLRHLSIWFLSAISSSILVKSGYLISHYRQASPSTANITANFGSWLGQLSRPTLVVVTDQIATCKLDTKWNST